MKGQGARMNFSIKTNEYSQEKDKLLVALQDLLSIDTVGVKSTLQQASNLLIEATGADKIDVFLVERSKEAIIAVGVSDTPMGVRQRQLGLDVLALNAGGREVEVFTTGVPYISGHVDLDLGVRPDFRFGLGARSMIIVPLNIEGRRGGIIQCVSARNEAFTEKDLHFLEAVAHWVGMVARHAALAEESAAQAADRARRSTADEMVAVLAHDMRNHLTPILGRLEMARRHLQSGASEVVASELAETSRAVRRLHNLVEDLLDDERLENGIFSISQEPVDLCSLVHVTASSLSTANHPIEYRIADDRPCLIEGDSSRLRQLLENLLLNAAKYSHDEVPVKIEMGSTKCHGRDFAVIAVSDNGPGVPEEVVPRLFSRFGTGDNSTGLGLGLYIARKIAEAHGGHLDYDAGYHEGARFRVFLPEGDVLSRTTGKLEANDHATNFS
jgi:two-component system, OmpR family, sensor kinase